MREQLDRLYKPPHPLVIAKALDRIDPHGRRFIELAPFLVIGSVSDAGVDVSPRGGGAGFVKVSEDGSSVLMPDRPGNNRLDTLKNIASGSGEVGLMFMIPGVDDILPGERRGEPSGRRRSRRPVRGIRQGPQGDPARHGPRGLPALPEGADARRPLGRIIQGRALDPAVAFRDGQRPASSWASPPPPTEEQVEGLRQSL